MEETTNSGKTLTFVEELEAALLLRYGPLIKGDALRQALGYPSMAAMKQSFLRGHAPVPIFNIEHRKGMYALTTDIAKWLIELREK